MIVAASTAYRQAQPGGPDCTDSIDHILCAVLFVVVAIIVIDCDVVAVKTGGNLVVKCGIGQKVPGDLTDRERVVSHVLVVGFNDPVSPRPCHPKGVRARIRVARQVQPRPGHVLPVMR